MTDHCGFALPLETDALTCDREPGHDGMHRDDGFGLYFYPKAPRLEWLEVP